MSQKVQTCDGHILSLQFPSTPLEIPLKKQLRQDIVGMVKACRPEAILRAVSHCDGYSILKSEAFTDAGLPKPVVEYMTRKYRSEDQSNGRMFVKGQPVKNLTGVDAFEILHFLAHALNIEYRRAVGRGREAQNIRAAIRKHFDAIVSARDFQQG